MRYSAPGRVTKLYEHLESDFPRIKAFCKVLRPNGSLTEDSVPLSLLRVRLDYRQNGTLCAPEPTWVAGAWQAPTPGFFADGHSTPCPIAPENPPC
jgi:hypothetical protein